MKTIQQKEKEDCQLTQNFIYNSFLIKEIISFLKVKNKIQY